MLNITVAAESAASPERVLALAGTDFSARRAKVWGNVKENVGRPPPVTAAFAK